MRSTPVVLAVAVPLATACGAGDPRDPAGWAGTIDTLASGQIVVQNTEDPIWPEGREWRVAEELRIGRVTGEGPDVFGQIESLEVDAAGRIWVLDSQAQELRVFDDVGSHIRTIGRRGGGPGEFAAAMHIELGPDSNIWVMESAEQSPVGFRHGWRLPGGQGRARNRDPSVAGRLR